MRSTYNRLADWLEHRFRFDARYFMRGGFWLSLGQFATVVFGLVSTALFAHFLTEQQYGIYRYLIGISVIVGSFSLTGLGQSILQATAKKFTTFYRETLKINFLYSLLTSVIAFIGVGYYWFKENETLAIGCLMIAIIQPLIITFQNTQSYLQGRQQYKTSTNLHVIRMLITTVISIGILFVTKSIIVLFLFYLVGMLVANLFGHGRYTKKIHGQTPPEVFHRYLQYAKHTSIRNAVANIAQRADTILIFTQLGAVELAIYSVATVIPEQIKSSFKNLATLLLPKYAEHTNTRALKKSVPGRSLQLFLVLLIISAIYILIAPYIYQLIFPKYPDAVFYSQLSALAFPAFILLIPYSILQAQLEETVLYKLTVFSSIFQVIIVFLGILTFGLLGAIIARIIYRLFFTTIIYSYLQKI